MQKSCIYNTVAMSNQFAMQRSHIYSTAVMSILKSQTSKTRGPFPPSPTHCMNSSVTVLWGRLTTSLVVQRLTSDELVVSSVIAPLLTVLLITFFLADIAEGNVTAHCIDGQLTHRGTAAAQNNKFFLKPSY